MPAAAATSSIRDGYGAMPISTALPDAAASWFMSIGGGGVGPKTACVLMLAIDARAPGSIGAGAVAAPENTPATGRCAWAMPACDGKRSGGSGAGAALIC